MPKPAFLVEGHMEQKIIQKLCPSSKVTLIGCNGADVDMPTMSRFIMAQIPLLKKYSPIVIIFDREKRRESSDFLTSELRKIIEKQFPNQIIIGIADRCLETWILSDWTSIRKKYPYLKDYKFTSDGINGKSIIKKLMPPDMTYHETTMGVSLFCAGVADNMRSNSSSFDKFAKQVDFSCFWLNRSS